MPASPANMPSRSRLRRSGRCGSSASDSPDVVIDSDGAQQTAFAPLVDGEACARLDLLSAKVRQSVFEGAGPSVVGAGVLRDSSGAWSRSNGDEMQKVRRQRVIPRGSSVEGAVAGPQGRCFLQAGDGCVQVGAGQR